MVGKLLLITLNYVSLPLPFFNFSFYNLLHFLCRSTKGLPAWKIAAGVALASSGGVVGAALAFHYSADVRTWWATNFPYLAPYLGTLGESLTGNKTSPILGGKVNNTSRDPTKPHSFDEPLNLGVSTHKAPQKVRNIILIVQRIQALFFHHLILHIDK